MKLPKLEIGRSRGQTIGTTPPVEDGPTFESMLPPASSQYGKSTERHGVFAALVDTTKNLSPRGFELEEIMRRVETLQPNTPLPKELPGYNYDGVFIGAGNNAYTGDSEVGLIPGVKPTGGVVKGRMLYVHGVQNTIESTSHAMQTMADKLHFEIVGIHSATQSFGLDLVGSVCDRFQIGPNPSVDTLSEALFQLLATEDAPIRLMGHSRGGLITARALCRLRNRLVIDEGHSVQSAEELLSKLHVYLVGVPAMSFPDGPHYVDFVNDDDVVATLQRRQPPRTERAGRDCEVIHFQEPGDGSLKSRHGILECYLDRVSQRLAS